MTQTASAAITPPIGPPREVAIQPDDGTNAVLKFLDAVHALPRNSTTGYLFASHAPPEAEYAFRLWASAHHFTLRESTTSLEEGKCRTVTIWDRWHIIATLQYPPAVEVN